jgi:hypothetical protein
MKRVFALLILGVFVASGAQATPISVSAGDFAVFNFDFTGETPPPPYSRFGIDVQLSGLDFEPPPCSEPGGLCEPLDKGEWKLWTELNGTGLTFFTFPAVNLNALWNFPEMNDGVFSLTLRMTEGSIIVDPIGCGIATDGTQTSACSQVPPPPAPEPAMLSLLASGAAAVALFRRRKPRV